MRRAFFLIPILAVAWIGTPAAPIHEEAKAGDLEAIRVRLEKDPGLLNLEDEIGRTPLFWACARGRPEAVAFLLGRGADHTLADQNGSTPLHAASALGDAAVVRALLDKGADPNSKNLQGQAPLNLAASNGREAAVRLLIERKADLENRDSRGRTPLITAARERGGAAVVQALLDAGATINAVDGGGDSALQLAAWRGYADVVDLLLDKGAEVPVAGPGGQQLLAFAVSKGLDRLFVAMVQKGADLAIEREGSTLLHAGASGGSVRILRGLVEKGQIVNAVDANGWTPLMFAADMGRTEAVSFLLSQGAEANARNTMGQSAWNIASEHGDKEIADLLAAKGAETSPPKFPLLAGPYLGQKPPGITPERFARGIVSGRYNLHSCIAFSPDGKEAMWSYSQPPRGSGFGSGRTLVTRLEGGRWTYPRPAAYGGVEVDDVPTFGVDGKKLYEMASRPLPGGPETGDENIWVWERSGSEWTRPRPVQGAVNEVPLHWQFGVDKRESVYVSTNVAGGRGQGDLYVSRYDKGRYGKPESLGDGVNTPADEATPFVSPDGRTLLFNRDLDLYASFLGRDGKWGEAVKLEGEVNTPAYELCPMLSPDGKYLFFLRGWAVYWVSAAILDNLRARAPGPSQAGGTATSKGSGGGGPLVVDGHNHEALSTAGGAIDTTNVADLQARGIDVAIVGLPIGRQRPADVEARVREEIARLRGMSANAPGFSLADDPAALLSGVPASGLQLFFSIEWPDGIFGGDPSAVRRYRDLGVRIIGLSEKNGDGLFGRGDLAATLTPFGTQIVDAMNEAGVLIDVTHLSHAQKLAVIARSSAPVVASHSLVQAVTPVGFNLPDEVVTALAQSGGSVWVSFNRSDLLGGAPDDEALERLVRHIEVLVQRLGEARVGIGTDFQAGGRYAPAPLNQDNAFALIGRRLLERGFSQQAVEGVLGRNVLRALAAGASARSSASPAGGPSSPIFLSQKTVGQKGVGS